MTSWQDKTHTTTVDISGQTWTSIWVGHDFLKSSCFAKKKMKEKIYIRVCGKIVGDGERERHIKECVGCEHLFYSLGFQGALREQQSHAMGALLVRRGLRQVD